jgi:transcriptional regulator with XRE-family HTH domain
MSQHLSTESQQFAHRLRTVMQAAGLPLSPTLVAHQFNLLYWGEGVTVHAARNWLNGISLPKPDKLRVLAHWLQVKPQDLMFGLDPKPAIMGVEEPSVHEALSLADEFMLERYRELSYEYQRMVKELVAALHLMTLQDKSVVRSNVPYASGTPHATGLASSDRQSE